MHRCIMIVAAALLPISAMAQTESPEYARAGIYIGAGAAIGTPTAYDDKSLNTLGIPGRADTSFGANASLGFRVLPWLAFEAEFDYLSGFDVTLSNDQALLDGNTFLVTANAKGFLLPESRIQPFVLAGGGYITSSSEIYVLVTVPNVPGLGTVRKTFPTGVEIGSQDFAMRFGGGIDGYITEHVVLSIDVKYVLPTGDAKDLRHVGVGVGLQYRF